MPIDLDHVYRTACSAARTAGDIIRRARSEADFSVEVKTSESNIVTTADLRAEAAILAVIRQAFPDHGILAEESAPGLTSASHKGPLWVVDPIDGTTNFVHNQLHVNVSIAFALAGRVEVGVIYAPFVEEIFTARRGHGAFLNERRLTPRSVDRLDRAVVAMGFPRSRELTSGWIKEVEAVARRCRDVRRLGAAALDIAWVAAGRLDGFWETVNPWDIAAGGLIARESGARTGHLYDRGVESSIPEELDAREFFVAAPGIYDELRRVIRDANGTA